jgi:peptide/nickel transport system substrate-binding protein
LNRLIGAVTAEASYAAWSEPTIEDYIARIGVEVDPVARAALYSELQQYMYDNPPFIYLYEPNTFEAINAAVQNYKPRAAENYYLKNVFLALPGE